MLQISKPSFFCPLPPRPASHCLCPSEVQADSVKLLPVGPDLTLTWSRPALLPRQQGEETGLRNNLFLGKKEGQERSDVSREEEEGGREGCLILFPDPPFS